MPEQLQEVIHRVMRGSRDEADIQAIAAALQAGQLTLVTGDRAIGVSGDVTNAILVTGSNNIIVRSEVAESLQAILEWFSLNSPKASASVDELVQQVRSRLHDDIQRLHGTMPLWGVDHWVPLGDLFVDVNILEELSSSHRAELDDLWQDFTTGMQGYSSYRSLDRIGLGKERQRVSGLEVLGKNTNLVVVGKPGSGKTTYLQRVVTEYNAGNLQAHRIPVLIKLREFVEDGRSLSYSLERYLERCWQLSTAETQLVLRQGRSLVLLDGLDEVTGEDGKTITKQIKQFARDYPQVQIVVTCRTQSFSGEMDWKSLRFSFVEVADFNEPQMRSFAEHWFKTVMQDEAGGLAKSREFLEQLFREGNKPIRELTITPILLSLTCAVFHQTGKFYSKRSKLYEEGLELLLEQWDKSREIERDEIYRDLSVERKLQLLSYLAVKKFEQEQYVLFEQAEIEKYIAEFLGIEVRASRAVLRSIEAQHGLLIERSQKIWSFSHLTFQEYLVAAHFRDSSNWEDLSGQATRNYWREVFLLVVDTTEDSNKLLQLMKKKIDTSLRDEKLQDYLNWLIRKADSLQFSYKESAIRSLILVLAFDDDSEDLLELPHSLGIDLDFNFLPSNSSASERLISEFAVDRNLKRALSFALLSNVPMASQVKIPIPIILKQIAQNELLYITPRNHKLEKIIQQSIDKFPDWWERISSPATVERITKWWEVNGEEWTEHLRAAMITHRDIGHDWQFNDGEEEQLKQYYEANKLLINCLSISNVNSEVREEIENTLLLPIAEIEKRNREKAE